MLVVWGLGEQGCLTTCGVESWGGLPEELLEYPCFVSLAMSRVWGLDCWTATPTGPGKLWHRFPKPLGFQTREASESPGQLVKTQIWGSSSPEFLIQYIWGRAWAFAFLANSPMMLMPPFWGVTLWEQLAYRIGLACRYPKWGDSFLGQGPGRLLIIEKGPSARNFADS